MSKSIVENYNGRVPRTYEELEQLPGVGHKTASVVMSQIWLSCLSSRYSYS